MVVILKDAIFQDVTLCASCSKCNIVPSSLILSILMMDVTSSFKISVLMRAMRCHIPEDGILKTKLTIYLPNQSPFFTKLF
jgi:hypothetical protein